MSFFENAAAAAMLPLLAPMAAVTAKMSLSLLALRPSAPVSSRSELVMRAVVLLSMVLMPTDAPKPALPPKLSAPATAVIERLFVAETPRLAPSMSELFT